MTEVVTEKTEKADKKEVAAKNQKSPKELVFFKIKGKEPVLPEYKSAGAAAVDLTLLDDVVLRPKEFTIVPLGFGVVIPEGYYGLLTSRSSTLSKYGVLVNQGVIDSDYCGPNDEVKVQLYRSEEFKTQSFVGSEKVNGAVVQKAYLPAEDPTDPRKVPVNFSSKRFRAGQAFEELTIIPKGTRVAQLLILPVGNFKTVWGEPKSEDRGGFGSTGA